MLKRACLILSTLFSIGSIANADPILLISVDGMRPADVLQSEALGVSLPFLQSVMRDGAYASDVVNVAPSITLPNHATLLTGATPAHHGIVDNLYFDPLKSRPGRYYFFASDIKLPTLWDAAHQCGAKVASLNWPASVGAPSIDDNIPEYFRDRDADDLKMVKALSTPGLMARLEKRTGASAALVTTESAPGDAALSQYAAALFTLDHPRFMTLHFASLDLAEHLSGPDSPASRVALEGIDRDIARVVAAGRAVWPDLKVIVVSDHGFAPLRHEINLYRRFAEAGLLTYDPSGQHLTSWEAVPTGAASAFVRLARPDDTALQHRVIELLSALKADPAYRIHRVLDRSAMDRLGVDPAASFLIDFDEGSELAQRVDGPIDAPSALKGTHGWLPDDANMHSSLFIVGPGVPKGTRLGQVNMLDIAPTIAKWIGCPLSGAEGKPLF